MRRPGLSTLLRVVLLSLGVAAASSIFWETEARLAGARGFPLDDAWIHLRFASSIARGDGYCFNPGEPSAGCTSPLWALLLAGAYRLTGEMIVTARVLGMLLLVVLAIASGRLAVRVTGRSVAGPMTAALVAVFPPLHWAALSGMEPILSATLLMLALERHLAAISVASGADFAASGLLGAATLARPENALFFLFVAIERLSRSRREGGVARMAHLSFVHALVFAAVLLPWAALNVRASGSALPGTFLAKISSPWSLARLVKAARSEPFWMFVDEMNSLPEWQPLLILTLGAGLLACAVWRRRESLLVIAGAFLFPVVRWCAIGMGRFDFQGGRYYVQAMPLLLILAVMGIMFSVEAVRPRSGNRALALATAFFIVTGVPGLRGSARHFSHCVKNVNEMQVTVGRWLHEHTLAGDLVAANDIGAVAIFGERRVLDTMALVTPGVVPFLYRPEASHGAFLDTDEDGLLEFIEQRHPEYLVIFPKWYPQISQRADLFDPVFRVQLDDNIICGANEMVVYRATWQNARR